MEFNLNDKNNLNPDLNNLKNYNENEGDIRKKKIEEWNSNPDVKKAGVMAIDISKYQIIKILALLGILSLVGIAISLGVFAYVAWNDGTLLSPASSMTCGNTNVSVEPMSCPPCPACNVNLKCPEDTKQNITCPSCICNPVIEFYNYGTNTTNTSQ